ncbi:hypothetical protein [Thalassobacillus hwangdonensis]|uniref:Phage protein n=1 Tax=Thalassobacillus hwangdonensis TaxID=546108 RepID=A0ABW3L1D2_9BACI
MLKDFLEDEISDEEFYKAIVEFISSWNIRCGEYEGNRFVIKKKDHENFLVYDEYEIDGKRVTHQTVPITKKDLLEKIHEHARKQGFTVTL